MKSVKIMLLGIAIMILGVGMIAPVVGSSWSALTFAGFAILILGGMITLFGFIKKDK